jgi:hypothetical protein
MPTVSVTYDYVYFTSGAGYTRQPRSATGPGGFTLINSLPGGTLQSGDTFAAGAQPSTLSVGGGVTIPPSPAKTYLFAFMNVSGGIPQGQTTPSGVSSFSSDAPPPSVTVSSTPIVVLVVYVPTGGGGTGGGSGAIIDSFDETTGQLFDDTFVTVAPDPGGPPPPLTTSGNVDGYVNTANTETITALSPTSPTGVDFDQWQLLYPQATSRFELGGLKGPTVVTVYPTGISVAGANLTVNSGTTVYALAFYKAPPSAPPPPPLTTCEELLKNWNALEPKTNKVLLAYYEEKLSACPGAQYAAAVAEIKSLLQGLNNLPNLPKQP